MTELPARENDGPSDALAALGGRLRQARKAQGHTQATLAARLGVSVPTLRAMETGSAQVAIGTWVRAFQALDRAAELAGLLGPAQPAGTATVTLPADIPAQLSSLLGDSAAPGEVSALVGALISRAADERRRTVLAREDMERKTAAAKQAIMERIRANPAIIDQARQYLAEVPDPWLRAQWQAFLDLPLAQMEAQLGAFRFQGGAPWHAMVQSSPFSKVAP